MSPRDLPTSIHPNLSSISILAVISLFTESVHELQNRPVPVAVAAAPPEALVIICSREEVAGRGDDAFGGGGGKNNNNKPPGKTAKKTAVTEGDDEIDPDDDGGVYEDNDEDAEGDGDAAEALVLVKLEEGSDVKVIGGSYRGRQGTVIGIIQMGGDNNGIQKYRVQLVPEAHRPTTAAPRKQATGKSKTFNNNDPNPIQHQLPHTAN